MFELLEQLHDQLWAQYASQIQRTCRDDLKPLRTQPKQLQLPFDDEHAPF